MSVRNNTKTLLMAFGAAMALAGCGNGADSVVSPGAGAFPPAPAPAPPPPPPPPTTPPPTSGPAASCPTGLTNIGTVANGTLRACQLPSRIVGNLVLSKLAGVAYAISGQTVVGDDMGGDAAAPVAGAQKGTLTIDPGVVLYGSAGADFVLVNRGSQMFAVGTKDQPITFTSRAGLEGGNTADSIGQWGGIILMGRAPINNCQGAVTPGTAACQALVEGANNAFYGGNAPNDNSGRLSYVRVLYSGYKIAENNELQALTLAGAGNATVVDHFQSYNSSDDGIEIFGGTVNLNHIVINGADDDGLDTDTGWNGATQFGIVVQRAGGGDRGTEQSNAGGSSKTPVSTPRVANYTFVGREGGGVGLMLNSGTNSAFYNTIVTGFSKGCMDIDDTGTNGTFHSVFFSCPKSFDDDADGVAAAKFAAGTNNTANGTSTLTGVFINGANETAVPAYGNLAGAHPFFQKVSYIGAVKDSADTWWQGWTCGLTADKPC